MGCPGTHDPRTDKIVRQYNFALEFAICLANKCHLLQKKHNSLLKLIPNLSIHFSGTEKGRDSIGSETAPRASFELVCRFCLVANSIFTGEIRSSRAHGRANCSRTSDRFITPSLGKSINQPQQSRLKTCITQRVM